MRRNVRKKRYTHRRRAPVPFIIGRLPAIAALLIMGVMLVTGINASRARPPLVRLPVPARLPEISYSGPLTLTHISQSVLGAEKIDPLDFVDEINKARAAAGFPPLRLSTTLMKAAQMRADVIMKYQNFSHQDPHEGIELATVLPKLNYHFAYASENIGMGGVSAPDFVNGFMHSTSHRENLLDPRLTDTGAAVVDGPFAQWYVNVAVQLFAIPGGKDEFLGYTGTDRTVYETSLRTISARLHPLVRLSDRLLHTTEFTDEDYRQMARQKEILESILPRMEKSEPLESRDVALILEYNALL